MQPRSDDARPASRAALAAVSWLVLASLGVPAGAAETTPQRPSFTTDASITAAGTVELEAGSTYADGTWTLPVTLKWTPGAGGWTDRTELSLTTDALVSTSVAGDRDTQFGNRVVLAARWALGSSGLVTWAVSPQATIIHRGDEGGRLGVVGIGVWSRGRHGLALNAAPSVAIDSGPGNPSARIDLAADYALALDGKARAALFAGLLDTEASGQDGALAAAAGLTFRPRPDLVLDVAVQRAGLRAGAEDTVLLGGLTVNLGR